MWAEVSAELAHEHSPLDVRVANAVRRLWSLDEEQRLRERAPGTAGPVMNAGLDGELQRLLEEVARAGSWSVWMGVFDRGWMQLRKRRRLADTGRIRLATGDGADLRAMWRGEVRAADVDGMSDELESSGSDGDVDDERGEGSGHEAAGAGRNLDPGAEERVATAVRLEEAARRRRLVRMRMLEARGLQRRQEARQLRRRGGQREERGRRRRERRGAGGNRGGGKRGGESGVARRRKRRRVNEETDSDDDSGDEAATVGRKRGREGDEGESGERNRLVAGRLVGGPGDERCQAAAAAVRRHRGGGGKRGWLA